MSISLKGVTYIYGQGTPYEKTALREIDLIINPGEFLGIIGHTGSGKSTLIQHLNGLLQPTAGMVTVDGIDLSKKNETTRLARNSVGMVFQYPEHQLFEETVAKDIAFGPTNLKIPAAEIEKRVREAMKFSGLDYNTLAERSPFRLSGGQMRRVAIAGVIALHPNYLVLDEPSAGLDPIGRREIYKEISRWHQVQKFTVILVSHNMEDISRLASRVIVMNKGKIMLDGRPLEVFLNHRQELSQAGVEVPPVSRLLSMLNEKGLKINENAIEVSEAAKNIYSWWKEEQNAL